MLSHQDTTVFAIAILAVGLVVIVVREFVRYCRLRYTAAQYTIYIVNLLLTRILWRANVAGPPLTRLKSGAVVVCNHIGPIDPCFVHIKSDRVVHWMVAKEFCFHPRVRWLFRITDSIPVSRGGIDAAATRKAISYAKEGRLVGLFPEGRINQTDAILLPGRPGAALIALKARVPVVPCYLTGSPDNGTMFGPLFMLARAKLHLGQPIDLSRYYGRENDKDVLEAVTKRLMTEMAHLAGAWDYQPQLAGRRWKPQNGQ